MRADYAKTSSTLPVGAPGHSIKPFGLILLGYALWHRGQILRIDPTIPIDQGTYLVALIFSSDLSGTKRFQLHQRRSIEKLCGTTMIAMVSSTQHPREDFMLLPA